MDGITNELMKYGGRELALELLVFIQKIFDNQEIPKDMRNSITIPIYKKGDKKRPENYGGITLLSSVLKIITKVTLNKLNMELENNEEQMGFRRNRSTTDAIYVVRQIVEKSIEL